MLAAMRSLLVLALVAAALAASGCGGSKKSSDADQVRSTWQSALAAVGAGDAAKLCSLLTTGAQSAISAQSHLSCADTVKLLASGLSAADRTAASHAAIRSVTVNGKRATIVFKPTPGLSRLGLNGTITLQKVGSHWLISGI
jgi:hypothetical protein